jgi:hypothetical protein
MVYIYYVFLYDTVNKPYFKKTYFLKKCPLYTYPLFYAQFCTFQVYYLHYGTI